MQALFWTYSLFVISVTARDRIAVSEVYVTLGLVFAYENTCIFTHCSRIIFLLLMGK